MKKFKSVYEVKSYSPILILNRIRENDLVVEDFKEISPYLFHFKAYKKDEKKLKKIMPDLNCINLILSLYVILFFLFIFLKE